MYKNSIYLFVLFSFLIFISCSSNSPKNTGKDADSISSEKKNADSITIVDGSIPIFYNMYLSVEMSTLFQSINAIYNSKILNSPDKAKMYDISSDKAINLGVYAVDLSYSKYFDQFEIAGKYLINMQKLSSELGIPSDKFYLSLKRIENNLANKDSLVKIANDIYKTTEDYLNKSERGSSAALIIAGGWTEAMYIATTMVKKNSADKELIERIAEQKHSINDLLTLLKKYEKDKVVKDYIIKFTDIKESLGLLDPKGKSEVLYASLSDLTVKISSLRKEMIN
jgi:hypothetical protein